MLDTIDHIAAQLQDAALGSGGWETALDSINAFVGGAGAVILSVEERLRHAPHSSDLHELVEDYFGNGWYANDRREGCAPLLRQKGIALDYEFLEVDEANAYNRRFLARHKRKWFAGLGANLDGDLWCLALQRSESQGAFLAADMPRLAAVQRHLEEAASLSRIVGRNWLNGAISALDEEGAAALVLDRVGRILEMNQAARSIVCGPSGTKSPQAFENMLLSRLAEGRRSGSHPTQMSVELKRQAYTIEVAPLSQKASLIFSGASSLVRIRAQSVDPERVLRSKYQLTNSEARVALALASGMSVSGMAEAFEVSPLTIRAQLKAAFAKTETGSQAKLVALIANARRP